MGRHRLTINGLQNLPADSDRPLGSLKYVLSFYCLLSCAVGRARRGQPRRSCFTSYVHLPPGSLGNRRVRFDQFVFRELIFRPATWLRGQDVFAYLRRMNATQWLPSSQLVDIQLSRLQALLFSARRESPAYAQRLAGLPAKVRSLDALRDVPTLSKQELRNEHAELQSVRPELFCVRKTTGGSTGEPVTLLKTRSAMAWELAATWRGYGWAGVGIGDRQARFWGVALDAKGRSKARLIDFVCHRRRYSAFDFNVQSFTKYERRLIDQSPDWFYGYASMLADFARWYAGAGRVCPVQPRAIVTTSEVLSPDDRAIITRSFRSRVFDEYGCGELGTIAHECPAGNLHTSDENVIVEILRRSALPPRREG